MSYPGLAVNKGRVSGSIVIDGTRLPLWAFVWQAAAHGWDDVSRSYDMGNIGYTVDDLGSFMSHLLEQRNEFGELILVLADVERTDKERINAEDDCTSALMIDWLRRPGEVKRVRAALHACLKSLETL